jgi:hypothetical protein
MGEESKENAQEKKEKSGLLRFKIVRAWGAAVLRPYTGLSD